MSALVLFTLLLCYLDYGLVNVLSLVKSNLYNHCIVVIVYIVLFSCYYYYCAWQRVLFGDRQLGGMITNWIIVAIDDLIMEMPILWVWTLCWHSSYI